MGRDAAIADRLRAAGLRVIEIDDWQVRGSTDFAPGGSVNHHTAGPSSGATPSLNTCIHGRPDLPGPLCNVFQSREPDGRDIAYVVAAGRANHAGEGGWRGLSGNRSVYGLEIEHTGTSPLSQARQEIAARIHAAMFKGDPANVCQHYEWAPARKPDAATDVNGDTFRELVRQARAPAPPPRRKAPEMMIYHEPVADRIYFDRGDTVTDMTGYDDEFWSMAGQGTPVVVCSKEWIQLLNNQDSPPPGSGVIYHNAESERMFYDRGGSLVDITGLDAEFWALAGAGMVVVPDVSDRFIELLRESQNAARQSSPER